MIRPATYASTQSEPFARGREFGLVQGDRIAATVDAYARLWRRLDPDADLRAWGERAHATIEQLAPRAADEIAGLAAGSGRRVHEIAALNARTEILAVLAPDGAACECSTVVSRRPDRAPVVAQTWDWYAAMRDDWLCWTFVSAEAGRVSTLTEYGVLAKIGVNESGLAVLLNLLHHADDDQRAVGADAVIGFPVHVLLRTLLEECRTVAEARALVTGLTFSASSAVTVADRAGDAASFETFPGGVGEVPLEDGLLVRTNHFLSAAGAPGCRVGLLDRNSWVRRDHLRAALTVDRPTGPADVLRAMSHHDPAGSVCRHAAGPDADGVLDPADTATLATVSIDLDAGELDAWVGGPCSLPPPVEEGPLGARRETR